MKKFEHGGNIRGKNVRYDFSVNTNPLGTDKRITAAAAAAVKNCGAYPDADYTGLRAAIARYEGVNAENIAVSNGASEMIFAVARAVMPKKAVLASPTFSEYERALTSVGCDISYYALKEENDFRTERDILGMLDGADMAFLCNPNNPTGTLCDYDIIREAAKRTVCVTDECFMDFMDGVSAKGITPVIKAFTKTHALAGLRIGYLVADAEFTERVRAQLPAWNVNAAAEAAAIAAVECGDYLKNSVGVIKAEREYLKNELTKIGFKVFPSDANFILVKGAEGVADKLLKRGILVRSCDNFRGLDSRFYRAAVKTRAENEILVRELGEIYG